LRILDVFFLGTAMMPQSSLPPQVRCALDKASPVADIGGRHRTRREIRKSAPHGKGKTGTMSAEDTRRSGVEPRFAERVSVSEVEEGRTLSPRFDADGLLPCVTTDAASGELLMLGYMNDEALRRTIVTGEAHYWSRSRQCLWRKGATSGFVQKVVEMRIDDDQDAVWLRVAVEGAASCHVGYRSCFYRAVPVGGDARDGADVLQFVETEKTFEPEAVYGDAPNPTRL
jgi:phosphoribosyl-AMP cyclohydrolase